MFETLLLIALPVFFIVCGAVAALSFARDPDEAETTALAATDTLTVANALPAAELFRPRRRVVEPKKELTFEEMIASVEAHLRTEHEAAKAFIHRPSAGALWVN